MAFPTEALATVIANAPIASTPGPSDALLLLQGGLLKNLPANAIPELTTSPTEVVNVSIYNATLSDQTIFVNRDPAAPTTVNMVSNPGRGRVVRVKDIAGNCDMTNTITIANCTIDGVSGKVLNSAFGYVQLESTGFGNNWANIT